MTTCETCRWYEPEEYDSGICRRFPPIARPKKRGEAIAFADWPYVVENDFCGEHSPKDPAQ